MERKRNDGRRLPKRGNLVFNTIKGLKRSKPINEGALTNKGDELFDKSEDERIDEEGDFDE